MAFDLITVLNFVLNLAIILVGLMAYMKTKNFVPLYIGLAFVLFSITHLLTLLDMATAMFYPIFVLRAMGYVTIIYTLYKMMAKPGKK
jgi:hypothetical protein